MARESVLRQYVTKGLTPFGHVIPVENTAYPGHPDLDICIGGRQSHLELKKLDAWPKRSTTPIRIEHYTPQQRLWLRQRHAAGGRCYVLVKVVREYFLFDMPTALDICTMTQADWRTACVHDWAGSINWGVLAAELRG